VVIRRVGALSCAKVTGLLYVILGLIFGACLSLVSLLGFDVGNRALQGMFGVGAIVLLPIFYGVLGFLGTLIMALLFNFAAGVTGGIEVDAS
jgi:hypothetical protein